MKLEDIKSGDVVVFTKVDSEVNRLREYEVGDSLVYVGQNDNFGRNDLHDFIFLEGSGGIGTIAVQAHFGSGVFDYLEKKIVIERDSKLTELGI